METAPPFPDPNGFPTPPPIPMRTRHLDGSKKRHTLTADYARPRTSKGGPGANRVTLQPDSTEVISSLISSLSAISTPAEDLFDKLLPEARLAPPTKSSPNTPLKAAYQNSESDYPEDIHQEQGLSYTGHGFLHPSDAALPPVIRTAKPPSGYSSVTAPNSKHRSLTGRGPSLSKSSPNLKQDAGSARSVGTPSIEPGSAHWSTDRLSAVPGGGGSRNSKEVSGRPSKERIREVDRDRRRKGKQPLREMEMSAQYHPGPPRRSFSDDVVPQAARQPFRGKTPQTAELPGDGASTPGGVGSVRGIPLRESSLKSPKRMGRKSHHGSKGTMQIHVEQPGEEARAGVEGAKAPIAGKRADVWPEPPTPQTVLATHTRGEEQSKRRIQELKELKQRRDETLQQQEQVQESGNHAQREREARRKANKGRASLPAPSTEETSSVPGKSPAKRRRGSDPSQKRPADLISPPTEKGDKQHHRTSSNAASTGRPSLGLSRDAERPSLDESINDAIAEYLAAPRLSNKIYHPHTGRAIAFSDVGDPDGLVVFCCLGMGTTRYLTAFYDELAATLGLRLITLDRPGIGESEPYRNGPESPLAWPDDVRAVCGHLGISRFSILAHSAGAIYALATALRMPRHIRGRIHLLAPWIPPSQMNAPSQEPAPVSALPMSQRLLRSLPTPFLKAANSSWFTLTSTSITTSIQKSPSKRSKRTSMGGGEKDTPPRPSHSTARPPRASSSGPRTGAGLSINTVLDPSMGPSILTPDSTTSPAPLSATLSSAATGLDSTLEAERQAAYDALLTQAIWAAATTGANPATDLMVCLERVHPIGFRYVDVTKPVTIHHGAHDSRVPVENVRWLGGMMKHCEVQVLDEEGHGLMANPIVMGDVLTRVAGEWGEWLKVTGALK